MPKMAAQSLSLEVLNPQEDKDLSSLVASHN